MADKCSDEAIYRYIGLVQRAGKLTSGEDGVLKAVRSGEAKLVICAGDASEKNAGRILDKCIYYNVPSSSFGTAQGLGHATGKTYRAYLAVTDAGFAKELIKRLKEAEGR